jgi:hypothetical protein
MIALVVCFCWNYRSLFSDDIVSVKMRNSTYVFDLKYQLSIEDPFPLVILNISKDGNNYCRQYIKMHHSKAPIGYYAGIYDVDDLVLKKTNRNEVVVLSKSEIIKYKNKTNAKSPLVLSSNRIEEFVRDGLACDDDGVLDRID